MRAGVTAEVGSRAIFTVGSEVSGWVGRCAQGPSPAAVLESPACEHSTNILALGMKDCLPLWYATNLAALC